MPLYTFSTGNPEGIDWLFNLQNDAVFTREKFQDICEEILCNAMEKHYAEHGFTSCSSIDTDYVLEMLKEKGFTVMAEISYHVEPYWGKDGIKSKKLLEILGRKDKFEADDLIENP